MRLISFYGTLRQERSARNYEGSLRHVRNDTVRGSLYALGWFPGWVPEGDGEVIVETYEVLNPAIIDSLDRYEGYHPTDISGSLFVRQIVTTVGGHETEIYRFNGHVDGRRRIESGDWFNK